MPVLKLYAGSTLRVLRQDCHPCAEHPDRHGRQITSAGRPVTEQHDKCVLTPHAEGVDGMPNIKRDQASQA